MHSSQFFAIHSHIKAMLRVKLLLHMHHFSQYSHQVKRKSHSLKLSWGIKMKYYYQNQDWLLNFDMTHFYILAQFLSVAFNLIWMLPGMVRMNQWTNYSMGCFQLQHASTISTNYSYFWQHCLVGPGMRSPLCFAPKPVTGGGTGWLRDSSWPLPMWMSVKKFKYLISLNRFTGLWTI